MKPAAIADLTIINHSYKFRPDWSNFSSTLRYRNPSAIYRLSKNIVYLRSRLYDSDPKLFFQYDYHLSRAIKSQRQELSKSLLSDHYPSHIILDNRKSRL